MMRSSKAVPALFILGWMLGSPRLAAAGEPELAQAIQLFEARKFAEAKAALQSIVRLDPRSSQAAYYLGRSYFNQEEFDDAASWLEKAVGLDSASSVYHQWLGRAYAQRAIRASLFKRPSLARSVRQEYEKSVALDPENLEARFDLIQFYLVAPGIMGGSTEKARAQAAEIAKRDALKGHRASANIFEAEKKLGDAEQEYLAAVQTNPQSKEARFWLGLFYQGQNRHDKALEVFEAMLKMDPSDAGAYYQIGKIGAISGKNLERAEECLKLYMQREPPEGNPPLPWAHYRLGMVYEKKGRKDLARQEYEAALKLQPGHKEAKEALKKLS